MPINFPERWLLAVSALVASMLVSLIPLPGVKVVAGLALALYLPGRAIVSRFVEVPLRWEEQQTLSIALSICLTILGGFLLHAFGSMNTGSWSISLAGITLLICLGPGKSRAACPAFSDGPSTAFSSRRLTGFIVAAGIVGAAFMIAGRGEAELGQPTYTELSMAPSLIHPSSEIVLEVRNREAQAQNYLLEIYSPSGPIAKWGSIYLEPNEAWSKVLSLGLGGIGSERIDARLYKNNNREVIYRHVWLSQRVSE
jgi:hypothetical protein